MFKLKVYLRAVCAALVKQCGGSAATEFALVVPVLLIILVGASEFAHAIDNWRKLTLLTRTVSDLTSQGDTQTPISRATMNDIFASASAVMRPFDTSAVKIVVSAMGVDLSKQGTKPFVCSSVANPNATARGTGLASDLTVPAGYQTTGVRYVLAEVSMDYRPMLGGAVIKLVGDASGTIRLSMSLPWPARGGQRYAKNGYTEVVLPDGTECK